MPTRRSFTAGLAATASGTLGPLARAAGAAASPPDVDVLVIGAGLSGLESALLLEELGARVQVIEARDRIGGRVYTLFDRPGYPEVGGGGFATGYGRLLNRAKVLGLPLADQTPLRAKYTKQELALDSRILQRDDWAHSPRNPLPEASRTRMPWEFAGAFIGTNNPLRSVDAWLAESNAPLDVSLHDWLVAHGLDERTISLCFSTNPYFGSSAFDVSALQCLYNDTWTKAVGQGSPASYAVVGGNQKLPIAMAKRLKSEVHLGREIVSIRDDNSRVNLTCRDGTRYRAKAVICSVPFPALRTVHFDPPLPARQAEAVNTLPYMMNTLFFFVPKRKFWEADGLSTTMWTDGPAGTVIGQRFGKGEEVTAIVANPRGNVAAALDRMPPADAIRLVQGEIERLRPAARGALEGGHMHSWARERFSGGDWAVYAPGQIQRFASAMSLPHGRIHFCGEHTAKANRGMEGAMESAERVVLELPEQL